MDVPLISTVSSLHVSNETILPGPSVPMQIAEKCSSFYTNIQQPTRPTVSVTHSSP